MLDEILAYAANHVLGSAFGFCMGLFLGNRMAIYRDRRQEFNAAAEPIRDWLLNEMPIAHPFTRLPARIELDTLEQCIGGWRGKRFAAAWERQKQERNAIRQRTPEGGTVFGDQARLQGYLRECLRYTRRR